MQGFRRLRYFLVYFIVLIFFEARPLIADDEDHNNKLFVWDISIVGNQNISTADLLDAIATTKSSHIPYVGKKYEFNSFTLYSDQKRIEHLYHRSGYLQAKVIKSDFSACNPEEPSKICIKIDLSEGLPAVVRKVAITISQPSSPAPPVVTADEILSYLGLNDGSLFNHDLYIKGKEAIKRHLEERSFPLPKIEGSVAFNATLNTVDISLEINAGTAAQIGDTIFKGLSHFRAKDVLKHFPYKPGEAYHPQKIEDAKDYLESLDVFRSIEVKPTPRKESPETVDLIYEVQEKPIKTLQIGFGLSIENSRQETRLRSEWSHHNFYNSMRKLSVSAEPRYAVIPSLFNPQQSGPLGSFEVALLQPAFLHSQQNLRTSLGFESDLEQGYRWYGPHWGTQISRSLSHNLVVSGGYSFRYLQFYDIGVSEVASNQLVPQELLFNKNYRLGFIDQRLSWDRRDNKFSPTKGGYATINLAQSAPMIGSSFLYLRIKPEYRHFFSLGRRAVLATRAEYGQIFNFGSRPSPITERFYGGGANDHRGFTYHRLSPQVAASDSKTVPVGGNMSVLFSIEQRYQLIQLADNWLLIGLFLDAGDVVEAPDKINLSNLHLAAGPGIRYETPVGIIRADIGIRLNRLDNETHGYSNPDPGQKIAVHVSFGEAF